MINGNRLLICVLTLNPDTVDNNCLGFVINRIKDTVVAYSDTVTLFLGKFPAGARSWVISKRKNSLIKLMSLWKWNIFCLFLGFFSNKYSVVQRFSHFCLNSSYGVKSLVSSSAFNKSFASSRSSISSMRCSYSSKLIKTSVFRPFSSTIYRGLMLFNSLCIFISPIQ